MMRKKLSAVITRGEIAFVSYCPELGVVSQGKTTKSALANLQEAVEIYLSDADVQKQLREKSFAKAKVYDLEVTA